MITKIGIILIRTKFFCQKIISYSPAINICHARPGLAVGRVVHVRGWCLFHHNDVSCAVGCQLGSVLALECGDAGDELAGYCGGHIIADVVGTLRQVAYEEACGGVEVFAVEAERAVPYEARKLVYWSERCGTFVCD